MSPFARRFLLVLRTLGWVLALPVLKVSLPLPRLVRLMWRSPRIDERDPVREAQAIALIDRVYGYGRVPRRHNCLERSLVMYRYLSELNAAPALMVALRRDGRTVGGHAWVIVDGDPVEERPHAVEQFQPVISFGDEGVAALTAAEGR